MPDSMAKSALDEQATDQALRGARRRALAGLVFWILTLPGFFVVGTLGCEALGGSLPEYAIPPLVAVSLGGIAVAQLRRERVARMRRALAVYPWQTHTQAAETDQRGGLLFRLPDPDNRAKTVTVRLRRPDARRWRRSMPSAAAQEFWFAGDPRFTGVMALPGPRRLTLVRQRDAGQYGRNATPPRGVSDQAWERACAVGQP